jgi:hypothetical protein
VGDLGLRSPTPFLEGTDMSEKEKESLAKIGEPDRVEIVPGLILEDKLRIKTQRRLEKKFDLPIAKIFPGRDKNTGEVWDGVDFNFLNNTIPLITVLAQQVDETITEEYIENIFESDGDNPALNKNIEKFFKKLVAGAKPKNRRKPNLKKKRK